MLQFLQTHGTQIVGGWATLMVVAQIAGERAAPGSAVWKVAHAFSAISPGDVAKIVRVLVKGGPS